MQRVSECAVYLSRWKNCYDVRRAIGLVLTELSVCNSPSEDDILLWSSGGSRGECFVAYRSIQKPAAADEQIVFLVDDDQDCRESLADLFSSVGLKVKMFGSAAEFLGSKLPDAVSCLVLDVRLPRLSGLDFQTELAGANIPIPIIFMTGYGDIPMSVKAMKAGAVDFLTKPVRDQDMLDAVMVALDRDRKRREDERQLADLKSRLGTLTEREREAMPLVTAGLLNKQIANHLGITEATVKMHRGQVMRKMGARSVADLVRMADALGIKGPPS
jgi:FixJ family two-component response regulator